MTLSLDVLSLGVPEVRRAREFYTAVLAPTESLAPIESLAPTVSPAAAVDDGGRQVRLDLYGTGRLALHATDALAAAAGADPGQPVAAGFRGYVLSFVVRQPAEVRSVVDAAAAGGATVLKPAKGSLFGAYSAVFRAPDGAVWKVSAPTRKDRRPAADPVVPTETAALLGVSDMRAARTFYAALGMKPDRDYKHYADFHPVEGTCRLGLMPWRTLAKDVGVGVDDGAGVDDGEGGDGFRAVVPHRRAASRDEVDATLAAAAAHGGRIAVPAREIEDGYAGHFADPDGFRWRVSAA